jgi:CHAT domain-containing protein/tetratricopeptide (TPR) repeat protein
MSILKKVKNLFYVRAILATNRDSFAFRRWQYQSAFLATLVLIFLSLSIASCSRAGKSLAPASVLQIAKTQIHNLTKNETRRYQIELRSKDYIQVFVGCTGLPITVTMYAPSGLLLKSHTCYSRLPSAVSVIVTETGVHQIETRLHNERDYPSEIQLTVRQVRPAIAGDAERSQAEELFALGESSYWKQEGNDPQIALASYQKSRSIWKQLGEVDNEVISLKAIGNAYSQQENYKLALENYQQALSIISPTDNSIKCELLNSLSQTKANLGDYKDASTHADAALSLATTLEYLTGIAQAWHNKGLIAYNRGEKLTAAEFYQKALQTWKQLNLPRELASTHTELVSVYADLRDSEKASVHFDQAMYFWRLINNKVGQAQVLIVRGNLYSFLGEKQEAKNLYRQAQETLQNISNKEEQARLLAAMAFFFKGMGDNESALEYYQQTRDIRQQLNQIIEEAGMWIVIGNTYRTMEKVEDALQAYQKALRLLKGKEAARYLPYALKGLGDVEVLRNGSQKAIYYYQLALKSQRRLGNIRGEADILNEIGEIYYKKNEYQRASKFHSQSLALNRQAGAQLETTKTLYYVARIALKRHQLDAALQHIKEAIGIIETLRAKVISIQNRISYFSSVHQCYELYINVMIELTQCYPDNRFVAESLAVAESARSRVLLEMLNETRFSIKQGINPQLLQTEHLLLQELNQLASQEMKLQGKQESSETALEISKKIRGVKGQLNDVQEKMRLNNHKLAAIVQPQPLKVEGVQQLLDDDTMLIEYALGDERSCVWAVTRNSIEAFTLPNRATIESLVREVYQLMTTSPQQEGETAGQWHQRVTQADQQYWPRAAKLSQMVLGPMAEKLGNKRLVIVGDGALQLLPFAALPKPQFRVSSFEFRGQKRDLQSNNPETRNPKLETSSTKPETRNSKPLIADHEITYLPSASSLQMLRQDRAKPAPPDNWLARWSHSIQSWLGQKPAPASLHSVAVLADPVFGKEDRRLRGKESNAAQSNQSQRRDVDLSDKNVFLPRLIATREEAEEIQKAAGANAFLLKQGFEVNRSLLESEELNRYGVIHFATHGFWDSANPELSGIFLSRFDQQGNNLEDGTLRLSDIYNLNLPKELVVLSACETAVGKDIRGEGLIALTRGFMYAGAARVMASLWKVEDNATAEMMKIFYQHLLQDKMSPAAALRQAQIAMWQKDPTQPPYNWAAFVLQGEYR